MNCSTGHPSSPRQVEVRPCDRWRDHFSFQFFPRVLRSIPPPHHVICSELTADSSVRFSMLHFPKLNFRKLWGYVAAVHLAKMVSASIFQTDIQWWRNMVLSLYNLILQWNVLPASWKVSTVVPVFKRGDVTNPDDCRPIALVSCAFKVFERLVQDCPPRRGTLSPLSSTFARRLTLHGSKLLWFDNRTKMSLWRTIANFLCGTLSLVATMGCLPLGLTRVPQGRVLSPLLFNLLINGIAAAIRRAAPGARLAANSNFSFSFQLYADDLVLLEESEGALQLALDAVSRWGLQWFFSFRIGPEKSAAVTDPFFPFVQSCRSLGVLLTRSLRWNAHAEHLPWSSSVCPMRLVGSRKRTPSVSLPHVSFLAPLMEWSSWAIAVAEWRGVVQLCGWPHSSGVSTCFLQVAIFQSPLLFSNTGSWAHRCQTVLEHHDIPADHAVGPRCSRRDVSAALFPVFDRAWHSRLTRALSLLTSSTSVAYAYVFYSRGVDPENARWWGLARHDLDSCPGGRPARHRSDPTSCLFCPWAVGDLQHWCVATHASPNDVARWATHPWIFEPGHDANSLRNVRGHVLFVGRGQSSSCALKSWQTSK